MIESKFTIGLGSQSATVTQSIVATLMRVFAGLLISTCLGLLFAIVISHIAWLRRVLLPYIQVIAPIAPIARVPLAMVLFGIGNMTAIFIVVLAVFPSLTIALTKSIEQIPPEYLVIANNMGCMPYQRIRYIILPYISPHIFTTLRLNFIAAWMAVLAAEMTGLKDGLGALIMIGRNLFDNNLILFGMCLIGLIGYCIDNVLMYCSNKYFRRGNR